MLNSAKSSSGNINLFYFLGVLMGICIRTGAKMILDLPRIVWKQLVGQRITLDDLRQVEVKFVKMLYDSLASSRNDYKDRPMQWVSTMPDGK